MVTAIDLFASAGGLTLGLQRAGIKTICAVELEPVRAATFAGHTPHANLITSDIRLVNFASYRGKAELVCGGPPCQPFSSGGHRRAGEDERDMVPAFIQVVRDVRPEAFLMENVPGLMAGDRLPYLKQVVEELTGLGYLVSSDVVNAADYGVPQKRRRLFLVGMRGRKFVFPEPTYGPGCKLPHVAVRDVLPDEPLGEPNASKVFYAKSPDIRPSPYDGHLFNGGGRPIDPAQPCHTILASAGGNKTHFFDDLGLVPKYHRHLLAGGAPRTGTLPGARRLTVRESAVIQTFPPDIVFSGSRSAQYQQVGDAVPPLLAAVLGKALVEQLRDGENKRKAVTSKRRATAGASRGATGGAGVKRKAGRRHVRDGHAGALWADEGHPG